MALLPSRVISDGGLRSEDEGAERLAPLRGAGVDVDVRRAGRVMAAVSLSALTILIVVLFVAGIQKNAQQTSLSQHGIAVKVTVTHCLGEMGGSGSTLAGYACTGSYTVDGKQYTESIPGSEPHDKGAAVQGITVRSDPTLLSTAAAMAAQPATWHVFVVPGTLTLVLALVAAAVGLLGRRAR